MRFVSYRPQSLWLLSVCVFVFLNAIDLELTGPIADIR